MTSFSQRQASPSGSASIQVEAKIMAAVWNRDRIVCVGMEPVIYQSLFRWLKSYIPRYRQLLLMGDVPKEIRHSNGAKVFEEKDLAVKKKALLDSLSEEEMGTPPIQVIDFGTNENTFRGLLNSIDRGWISFSPDCHRKTLEKMGHQVHEEIPLSWGKVFLLDPSPLDLSQEEELLLETDPCSPAVRDFMIQIRQSQVHLAFQAIIAELESGRPLTRPYLSETLRVREKSLKKILHVGQRERRLDLASYIRDTSPRIIEFLRGLSREREAMLAALFDGDNLIGYARYKDCFFPSRNFLALNREMEKLRGTNCDPDQPWFLEVTAGDRVVHVFRGRYLYGFLLEDGTESTVFRYRAAEGIEKLEKEAD